MEQRRSVAPGRMMRLRGWLMNWRTLRRAAQLLMLAAFLVLFRLTEYHGQDDLAEPVNFFFRIDPLTAAAAMLAAKTILWVLWPAAVVLGLTLIFGRFFCGWVCPLGTLLDLFHRITRPLTRRTNRLLKHRLASLGPIRYILLILVLVAALVGLPLVGYLDPFSLLTRGLALAVDPAAYHSVGNVFDSDGRFDTFVRDYLLPYKHKVYPLVSVSAIILAIIFALELVGRRFWCRYLCPAGAIIGACSRSAMLKRLPVRNCGKCPAAADCATTCRMGALDRSAAIAPDECTLCMDCTTDCPASVAKFSFKRSRMPVAPVNLSRRSALTALAFGVGVPIVVRGARVGHASPTDPKLLRPPGAADEREFLNRCIRCGLCLKVCPTNGLQPAVFSAGLEGIFSPVLVPRTGYCELNCTLCGQVCPTEAIPRLSREKKATAVIGKAIIDFDRCLPWAKDEQCICCEEHCPVPDKAIQYDEMEVKQADGSTITLQYPYIVLERCIGCGICENKCPIDGESAITVLREAAVPREQPQHGGRGFGRGRGGGAGQGRGAGQGMGPGAGQGRGFRGGRGPLLP